MPLAAVEQEVGDGKVSVQRNGKGLCESLPILCKYYCHPFFSLSFPHPKTGVDV